MENDLISRSALLEDLKAWHKLLGGTTNPLAHAVQDVLASIMCTVNEREAVEAEPKWISVEERLPENGRMVLAFTPCDGYMFVGYYHTNKLGDHEWSKWYIVTAMRSTKDMRKKVTHWMPLPELPKEEHHAD